MKPNYTHTIGVDLPRKIFSRESIKQMDKRFSTHKDIEEYYTGLAGRRMCFAFPDEETKVKFIEIFNDLFKSVTIKQK
jgi:hypothetical protein